MSPQELGQPGQSELLFKAKRVMSLRAVGAFAAASGLAFGAWAHLARRRRAAEHTQSKSVPPTQCTRSRRRALVIVAGAGIGALVGASVGTGISMYSLGMSVGDGCEFVKTFYPGSPIYKGSPPARLGLARLNLLW